MGAELGKAVGRLTVLSELQDLTLPAHSERIQVQLVKTNGALLD